MDFVIREAQKTDQVSIIELIDEVYREYGDSVCLEGADKDLTDIVKHYLSNGGQFWVLIDQVGTVHATHAAIATVEDGVCTFRRLYLREPLRGKRLGYKLMDLTVDWAREKNFQRVEFWSDTRFERAHAFFEKYGFTDTGKRRDMVDGNLPYSERQYRLEL